jgi:hypothetical protein
MPASPQNSSSNATTIPSPLGSNACWAKKSSEYRPILAASSSMGHGVSSRSSHSEPAGRITLAAKSCTQPRVSRRSALSSREKPPSVAAAPGAGSVSCSLPMLLLATRPSLCYSRVTLWAEEREAPDDHDSRRPCTGLGSCSQGKTAVPRGRQLFPAEDSARSGSRGRRGQRTGAGPSRHCRTGHRRHPRRWTWRGAPAGARRHRDVRGLVRRAHRTAHPDRGRRHHAGAFRTRHAGLVHQEPGSRRTFESASVFRT